MAAQEQKICGEVNSWETTASSKEVGAPETPNWWEMGPYGAGGDHGQPAELHSPRRTGLTSTLQLVIGEGRSEGAFALVPVWGRGGQAILLTLLLSEIAHVSNKKHTVIVLNLFYAVNFLYTMSHVS